MRTTRRRKMQLTAAKAGASWLGIYRSIIGKDGKEGELMQKHAEMTAYEGDVNAALERVNDVVAGFRSLSHKQQSAAVDRIQQRIFEAI